MAKARDRSNVRTVVATSPPLQIPGSFEDFVIDLSVHLAGARPEAVDAAIIEGLRMLGSFLGLQRAFLCRWDGGLMAPTHAWISDALEPHQAAFLETLDPEQVWLARHCLAGNTVVIEDVGDLPEEAAFDRAYFEDHELVSTVFIPALLGTEVFGAVALDSYSTPIRRMPRAIDRLTVPVELLRQTLFASDQRKQILHLSAFETVVADICGRLAAAGAAEMEDAVQDCLARLGGFFAADRIFLGRMSDDHGSLTISHRWAAEQVSPDSKIIEMDLASAQPWLARQVSAGKVIDAGPRLSRLPDEARALREQLERDGINSGLVVPVRVRSKSIGMLVLDTVTEPREYPPEIVRRLRHTADVIANALDRAQAQREVEELKRRLERENLYLREESASPASRGEIIGNSTALAEVLDQARQVAATDSTVLILGETGTGKELLATYIHQESGRADRTLVKINCGALPATLVEAELFGRERGAYTGALSKQIGRFEIADGSTLFLDEIGDLPLELQVKLLRVLQDGEFERLGSGKTIKADVRVLAASNRDLGEAVHEGRFREDLFYRLNVFPITVPPLRERREDIPELLWTFIREFVASMGKPIETVPRRTMERLTSYPWPGNVRELKNVVERAMIVSRGPELEVRMAATALSPRTHGPASTLLDDVQRRHILDILERSRWRLRGQGGAAELLGMKPSTLEYRMKKLGIERPR